ncbi:MAG: DUF4238 domain-containing protein [Eubacteriales bacterium]|nr:DUF4238 domain-containing protein [Eubacteriales bacterium]
MSRDHIAIPKFIEEGFSKDGKTFVYDLIRDNEYIGSIKKLGTKNNYYDNDVEKDILGSKVELEFSIIYHNICNAKNVVEMKHIIDDNFQLIERFFSFMFLRSKKTLDTINKECISTKIIGDIDHSELLRIQANTHTNPLSVIGKEYHFYPLINLSNKLFINNSVGFGLMKNKNGEYSFIIPLNTELAIIITNIDIGKNNSHLFIEKEDENKVDRINKKICEMEKAYGNGFIFGIDECDITAYKEFIKRC